jgi:hypothetical protein
MLMPLWRQPVLPSKVNGLLSPVFSERIASRNSRISSRNGSRNSPVLKRCQWGSRLCCRNTTYAGTPLGCKYFKSKCWICRQDRGPKFHRSRRWLLQSTPPFPLVQTTDLIQLALQLPIAAAELTNCQTVKLTTLRLLNGHQLVSTPPLPPGMLDLYTLHRTLERPSPPETPSFIRLPRRHHSMPF